ncbi:MAG: Bug family tripartite tricarboxylate transporter substrate binding protein [Burkholderiales bacterium]
MNSVNIARLACAALAAAAAGAAFPQAGYPGKPVRLVVPSSAGGGTDIVARIIAPELTKRLGQQVVIDNRPGAGTMIGIEAAAKSPPDGYTVLLATPGIAISPSLYSKLGYDAATDFAPVARVTAIQNILVVHPSVPATTLRQFISLARAHPGKLNFASGGPGTTNHLANELLKHLERINMVHVPYKGATLGMLAMIGGEVDEVIVPVASAIPQIRAGKVRPLAVLSVERVPTLPDVPTAKEAGVDNFVVSLWYGMFAPARTPRDIVARLSREVIKALESPDLRERLTAMGVDPWPGTPEELASLVRSETARYATIIKSIGLRLD